MAELRVNDTVVYPLPPAVSHIITAFGYNVENQVFSFYASDTVYRYKKGILYHKIRFRSLAVLHGQMQNVYRNSFCISRLSSKSKISFSFVGFWKKKNDTKHMKTIKNNRLLVTKNATNASKE